MTNNEPQHLLDMLDKTHSEIRSTIKGADLETPVYNDAGWQIRDILGHIAIWDGEVAKSIRAYKEGRKYSIPNFNEDEFNTQSTLEMRELSAQRVFEEWEQARDEFKAAVEDLSLFQFLGEILYPWGDERGNVTQLVEYMCEHDEEHRTEIQAALQGA
jgi:hypothetical protein